MRRYSEAVKADVRRGMPFRCMELAEGGIKLIKRLIGLLTDLSPRLAAQDPLHNRQVLD